ncbi:hypothetical protein BD311DRAFT_392648 [Dichomitus squalens]|uniref:Uncharacterized protein n=1 Tax=Dichomitus squalens TaxID=114155 RepID=A0A4Q9N423_9APHY|nr:hypothetical protein BD311DRAFT_392648 [Dichomitus squalens]
MRYAYGSPKLPDFTWNKVNRLNLSLQDTSQTNHQTCLVSDHGHCRDLRHTADNPTAVKVSSEAQMSALEKPLV